MSNPSNIPAKIAVLSPGAPDKPFTGEIAKNTTYLEEKKEEIEKKRITNKQQMTNRSSVVCLLPTCLLPLLPSISSAPPRENTFALTCIPYNTHLFHEYFVRSWLTLVPKH